MNNCFIKSPPIIAIYKNGAIEKIYCVVGEVPDNIQEAILKKHERTLENFYGKHYKNKLLMQGGAALKKLGGADDDFSDLMSNVDTLLQTQPTPSSTSTSASASASNIDRDRRRSRMKEGDFVEYVFHSQIYPEDKFYELREKIMIITGIEYYRQHVFYKTCEEKLATVYRLVTEENGIYNVDISESSAERIFGIPIDRKLYDYKDDIKVEALEYFQLLRDSDAIGNVYYVADLEDYLTEYTQLKKSVNDTYIMHLIYYGFIIKYFPVLSFDAFYDLINSKDSFNAKYPDIIKDYKMLEHKYKYEREILNRMYNESQINPSDMLFVSISSASAIVASNGVRINIRNLFDALETSLKMPYIRAYVKHDNNSYQLNKKTQLVHKVPMPTIIQINSGIICAINVNSADETLAANYAYLNIDTAGNYTVLSQWNDEDEINFDKLRTILIKFINPVIKSINELSANVITGEISELKRIKYKTLSVGLSWRAILNSEQYRALKNALNPYFESEIVKQHLIKVSSGFEILFRKGIYDYDREKLTKIFLMNNSQFVNQYAHLISQAVRQKWSQNYDGKVMNVNHQITAIKFEIFNVNEEEFNYVYHSMAAFVRQLADSKKFKIDAAHSTANIKPLKKLKEIDPELYNIKKYNGKRVYSVICQSEHQPIIYDENEPRDADAIKYWNFTHNKPAYYKCPNKEFPHLSFIVGMHPKNYCLPCCHKKESDKKNELINSCIKKHVVNPQETQFVKYIFQYSPTVEPGRISYLPPQLSKIAAKHNAELYLLFMPSTYAHVANVDILHIMEYILKIPISQIINEIARRTDTHAFNKLIAGRMIEYFDNLAAFKSALNDFFKANNVISVWNKKPVDWNFIFLDMLSAFFEIQVIIDEPGADNGADEALYPTVRTQIFLENKTENGKFIIVAKHDENYALVVTRDRSAILSSDSFMDYILDALRSTKIHSKSISLSALKKLKEYEVVEKLINKSGLCYAAILRDKAATTKTIYVPVKYVINIADGIAENYHMHLGNASHQDMLKFVEAFNKANIYKHIKFDRIIQFENGITGYASGELMFYVADKELAKIDAEIRTWYVDPVAVANDILDRRDIVENNMNKFIGRAIYTDYLYQLILLEFSAYCAKDKNKEMRRKIIKQFEADKTIPDVENPVDEFILNGLLRTPSTFLAEFEKIRFSFDDVTINKLKAMPDAELIEELKKMLAELTVDKMPVLHGNIDNSFTPCHYSSKSKLCEGKKLMVKDVAKYAPILARDVKYNNIDITSANYINFLDFEKQLNAVIDVVRL